MNDTRTDRGQLILAGAVSFALILIAIAVVFSTTLFTASVGSSGTVETVSDGTGTAQAVEHTTRGLLERVNQQNDWLLTQNRTFLDRTYDESAVEPNLRSNLSTYDRLFAESKTETGATYLNTTTGGFRYGTRVTQDWNSVGSSGTFIEDGPVGDFVVVVNASDTIGGSVNVTASEVGGSGVSYVNVTDLGMGNSVTIESRDGNGATRSCSFSNPTNDTVYVDLTSGYATDEPFVERARDDGCLRPLTAGIETPYDVEAASTLTVEMAYDYTVADSATLPGSVLTGTREDVIWSTEVSLLYESPRVLRESTTEVSSYQP